MKLLPDKSGACLTPFVVVTILLTVFPTLPPWLYCNYQFIHLNSSPFSPSPHILTVWQLSNVPCIHEFVCFVFETPHTREVIQCLSSLSDLLHSAQHPPGPSLWPVARFHSFGMAESYAIVYTHHFFSIYSSIDGHLGFFHILATVKNIAMNIWVYVF